MFDIIILLIIIGFIWKGVKLGFIESLGGIVGVIFGLLAAGRWWQVVAGSLEPLFSNQWLSMILGWVLVFIVVNRLIAFIFWIIDKLFHIVAIIPFLKSINSLLGGLLGLIEGFLLIGSIISIILLTPFNGLVTSKTSNSKFTRIFSFVNVFAQKLTPESVKDWEKGLPFIEKINSLKDLNTTQLNPFSGFSDEVTDGLNFLQNKVKETGSLGSTSTPVSGSYNAGIPDDAFEPTPAE